MATSASLPAVVHSKRPPSLSGDTAYSSKRVKITALIIECFRVAVKPFLKRVEKQILIKIAFP
jgi:hypothetical protein